MMMLWRIAELGLLGAFVIFVALTLFAVSAGLSLERGRRPGVEALTIAEAAKQLGASGMEGWTLVEAAGALVSDRMK